MPRFFISSSDIETGADGSCVTLRGDDAHHASKVLRIRNGERVTVCDETGTEYDTEADIGRGSVRLRILPGSERRSASEAPYEATVFQALAKGDRFDTVVRKSTELGAVRIVPVYTSRCDVVPDPATADQKRTRWQRIAYEASKQSGRARIPEVSSCEGIREAAEEAGATSDLVLICQPGGECIGQVLSKAGRSARISVFIGPEGGFTEDEAILAEKHGAVRVSLGPRILRTETASSYVLSCLSYEYENR